MGAGTWLLARPPVAVSRCLGLCRGWSWSGLALPACLGGNLALGFLSGMSLLSPGLAVLSPVLTHTEHEASLPSPVGLKVLWLLSQPLSPPASLCSCPPELLPLLSATVRAAGCVCFSSIPSCKRAKASYLGPSCSHCKKIFSILISFSHF